MTSRTFDDDDTPAPHGRSGARRRALEILYAAELRGESPAEALEREAAEGSAPSHAYATELIRGVAERQERLDEVIAGFLTADWSLERIPAVDRTALRMGAWELLFVDDVPDTVAVTEAMTLVRDLSTDESPQFVNGVLGSIQRNKASLV